MNETQRQRDIEDRIDRDIQFACGTGVGLIAIRLFGLVMVFLTAGIGSLGVRPIAQVSIGIALVGLFTYGTYHRRMWGPVGQLALWGAGFFVGWYSSHGLVPPLGILSLVVWYGFYCGLRGVRDAREQRRAAEQAALTPVS
jgi:hypothetical protein